MTKIIPLKPFGKDPNDLVSVVDGTIISPSDQNRSKKPKDPAEKNNFINFKINETNPLINLEGIFWQKEYWHVWLHPNFLGGKRATYAAWQNVNKLVVEDRKKNNVMPGFGFGSADFYHAVFRALWDHRDQEFSREVETVRQIFAYTFGEREICMASYAQLLAGNKFVGHGPLPVSGSRTTKMENQGLDTLVGTPCNQPWCAFMLGERNYQKVDLIYSWLLGELNVVLKKIPISSGDVEMTFTIRHPPKENGYIGTYRENNELFSAIGIYAKTGSGVEFP